VLVGSKEAISHAALCSAVDKSWNNVSTIKVAEHSTAVGGRHFVVDNICPESAALIDRLDEGYWSDSEDVTVPSM